MLIEIVNRRHFMRAETQAKYPDIFPTYESRRVELEAKRAYLLERMRAGAQKRREKMLAKSEAKRESKA